MPAQEIDLRVAGSSVHGWVYEKKGLNDPLLGSPEVPFTLFLLVGSLESNQPKGLGFPYNKDPKKVPLISATPEGWFGGIVRAVCSEVRGRVSDTAAMCSRGHVTLNTPNPAHGQK